MPTDAPARPRKPFDLIDQVINQKLRVLWISETFKHVDELLAELAADAIHAEKPGRVRRAHDYQRYEAPDGVGAIVFTTPRSVRVRGFTADLVVVDETAGNPASWPAAFRVDVAAAAMLGAGVIELTRG